MSTSSAFSQVIKSAAPNSDIAKQLDLRYLVSIREHIHVFGDLINTLQQIQNENDMEVLKVLNNQLVKHINALKIIENQDIEYGNAKDLDNAIYQFVQRHMQFLNTDLYVRNQVTVFLNLMSSFLHSHIQGLTLIKIPSDQKYQRPPLAYQVWPFKQFQTQFDVNTRKAFSFLDLQCENIQGRYIDGYDQHNEYSHSFVTVWDRFSSAISELYKVTDENGGIYKYAENLDNFQGQLEAEQKFGQLFAPQTIQYVEYLSQQLDQKKENVLQNIKQNQGYIFGPPIRHTYTGFSQLSAFLDFMGGIEQSLYLRHIAKQQNIYQQYLDYKYFGAHTYLQKKEINPDKWLQIGMHLYDSIVSTGYDDVLGDFGTIYGALIDINKEIGQKYVQQLQVLPYDLRKSIVESMNLQNADNKQEQGLLKGNYAPPPLPSSSGTRTQNPADNKQEQGLSKENYGAPPITRTQNPADNKQEQGLLKGNYGAPSLPSSSGTRTQNPADNKQKQEVSKENYGAPPITRTQNPADNKQKQGVSKENYGAPPITRTQNPANNKQKQGLLKGNQDISESQIESMNILQLTQLAQQYITKGDSLKEQINQNEQQIEDIQQQIDFIKLLKPEQEGQNLMMSLQQKEFYQQTQGMDNEQKQKFLKDKEDQLQTTLKNIRQTIQDQKSERDGYEKYFDRLKSVIEKLLGQEAVEYEEEEGGSPVIKGGSGDFEAFLKLSRDYYNKNSEIESKIKILNLLRRLQHGKNNDDQWAEFADSFLDVLAAAEDLDQIHVLVKQAQKNRDDYVEKYNKDEDIQKTQINKMMRLGTVINNLEKQELTLPVEKIPVVVVLGGEDNDNDITQQYINKNITSDDLKCYIPFKGRIDKIINHRLTQIDQNEIMMFVADQQDWDKISQLALTHPPLLDQHGFSLNSINFLKVIMHMFVESTKRLGNGEYFNVLQDFDIIFVDSKLLHSVYYDNKNIFTVLEYIGFTPPQKQTTVEYFKYYTTLWLVLFIIYKICLFQELQNQQPPHDINIKQFLHNQEIIRLMNPYDKTNMGLVILPLIMCFGNTSQKFDEYLQQQTEQQYRNIAQGIRNNDIQLVKFNKNDDVHEKIQKLYNLNIKDPNSVFLAYYV